MSDATHQLKRLAILMLLVTGHLLACGCIIYATYTLFHTPGIIGLTGICLLRWMQLLEYTP